MCPSDSASRNSSFEPFLHPASCASRATTTRALFGTASVAYELYVSVGTLLFGLAESKHRQPSPPPRSIYFAMQIGGSVMRITVLVGNPQAPVTHTCDRRARGRTPFRADRRRPRPRCRSRRHLPASLPMTSSGNRSAAARGGDRRSARRRHSDVQGQLHRSPQGVAGPLPSGGLRPLLAELGASMPTRTCPSLFHASTRPPSRWSNDWRHAEQH